MTKKINEKKNLPEGRFDLLLFAATVGYVLTTTQQTESRAIRQVRGYGLRSAITE